MHIGFRGSRTTQFIHRLSMFEHLKQNKQEFSEKRLDS